MKTNLNWMVQGLFFGLFMLIVTNAIALYNDVFSWDNKVYEIILAVILGLVYGYVTHFLRGRKSKK